MSAKRLEEVDRPERGPAGNAQWGSDPIAQLLNRLDFKYVALVPGASYRGLHDSIVNLLGNENPQIIPCLHEEHSVAIAHGYAKVTNRPMLACLHSNVGLMHATMAIYNAWCDRMPMVTIGATGPVDAHERRPWIDWIHTSKDQGALVRNYVKWDDQPISAPAALESVLRATQIATTAPHGPTYVCLDVDMQEVALTASLPIPDVARFRAAQPPAPSADQIETAVAWLTAAKRPVLMCGRVTRSHEGWDGRVELGELIGGAVLSDFRTGGSFPTTHGLHVAPPVTRLSPTATELLQKADVILALDWMDLAGTLKTAAKKGDVTAKIIHVSADSLIHNGWSMDHQALPAVDLPILATPDSVLAPLIAALKAKTGGARHAKPKYDVTIAPPAPRGGGAASGLTMRQLAKSVAENVAGRATTFTRFALNWPTDALPIEGPLDFLGGDGGGGLGSGPGIAVGAALALRESGRIPIAVLGDGDFLMGVNALWSGAHARTPLLIIVANNRSYNNDVTHQDQVAQDRGRPRANKWIGQNLDDPPVDLAAMARAQGFTADGAVASLADLDAALKRGLDIVAGGGLHVIDVLIESPAGGRSDGHGH